MPKFAGLNVQVLGISVDHVPCLKAWANSLGGIHFPLLSDFWPHGAVAQQYGVFRTDGRSERAIFIIDREGVIRYIDVHDIDDQPSNEVLLAELGRILPPEAQARSAIEPPPPAELPHGGVVMYCTNWCPDCKTARAWLKERNIAFTEVNVTHTPGAEEQVRRWSGGAFITPVFDINGSIVIDFDPEKLEEALKGL